MKLIEYRCPVCNSESQREIFSSTYSERTAVMPHDLACTSSTHGIHFRIVECTNCAMRFCSPRPDEKDLLSLYRAVSGEAYHAEESGRSRTFAESLKRIKGTTLLDIGAGKGDFVASAKANGFIAEGVEPSLFATTHAQERGQRVQCGAIPEFTLGKQFSVITLWDVLEHVHDPRSVVRWIYEHLEPGGSFHLSTMDCRALYPQLMGARWPWYMLMHIHYFSIKQLRQLLSEVGFIDIQVFPYAHTIHKEYLIKKIPHLPKLLAFLARLAVRFLSDHEGFIRVCLYDIVHVSARRPG